MVGQPGHSIYNMEVAAIEKVFDRGRKIIEKRESIWIENLKAEYKGLNKKTVNLFVVVFI